MNKISQVILYTCLILSCNKKEQNVQIIVKDCTGSYLRSNGFDFRICNLNKIKDYEDSQEVSCEFKGIQKCEDSLTMSLNYCEKLHKNSGWIEIISISKK